MSRRLTAEDFWRLRRVGAPAPTPDGSHAVVPITEHAPDGGKGVTSLWLVSADGTAPRRLTRPELGSASQPAICPNSRWVAFVREPPEPPTGAGRDGQKPRPQLHLMRIDGGEPHCLTDFPLGCRDPRWTPAGDRLVCVAEVLRDAPTLESTRARLLARDDDPVPHVTEDRVYRFWDRWLTGGEVPHLFAVEPESGATRDLTPTSVGWFSFMEPTGQYDIAPDGREVAFAANASEPPHHRPRWALFTAPLDAEGSLRCLTPNHLGQDSRPRYTPDGRFLLFGTTRRGDFYADRVRLSRIDRTSAEEQVLTEPWDRSANAWEIGADGTVWVEAEEAGRCHLWRTSAHGDTPERVTDGGWISAVRPADDGSLWFLHQDLATPPEVRRRGPDGTISTLGDFNREQLAGITLGEVEERRVAGAEGEEVQVFLVHPPGGRGERPTPLVHLIHGGPHGVFGDQFHPRWNAQLFAAPGYTVAMVNFHGSASFGTPFLESIIARWGDQPAQDVQAVTDHLVEAGIADPARVAIAGGSYGGYLVAWLAGQTDRFACGVCHAGVYDLDSMYASDVTDGMRTTIGAVPWEDREAVERYNPASRVEHVRTPMLVLHGMRDYRVPYTQALHFYGILKAREVPARLVVYPDENHWILAPRNSVHWYGEVHAWLARYLTDADASDAASDEGVGGAQPA